MAHADIIGADGLAAQTRTSNRNPVLDLLRGFFLVLMTADHMYGAAAGYAFEAFGFVTAAEGFVFLSAFLAARVYGRLLEEDPARFRHKVATRALTLYVAHALMVSFVVAGVAGRAGEAPAAGAYAPFQVAPLEYFFKALTFQFQPQFLDVLPMYVLFVAALPVLLPALRRLPLLVVAVSATIWGVSLVTPVETWIEGAAVFVYPSWQLLFVAGAALGSLPRAVNRHVLASNVVLALALGIILFGLLWRHADTAPLADWFIARPKLGPYRVLTTLAFAVLIGRFTAAVPPVRSRWLEFLGQHSLYVFIWHFPLVLLCQPAQLIEAIETFRGAALGASARFTVDLGITVLALASLAVPAHLHQKMRAAVQGAEGS